MAKELLKEAIADAKAVREVALQNAKMALEEAFDSKLKNMLSAKLAEELEEDVELEEAFDIDPNDIDWEDIEPDAENRPDYQEGTIYGTSDDGREWKAHGYYTEFDGYQVIGDLEAIEETSEGMSYEEDDELDEEINLDELMAELESLEEGDDEEEEEAVEEGLKDFIKNVKAAAGGEGKKVGDWVAKQSPEMIAKAREDKGAYQDLVAKLRKDLGQEDGDTMARRFDALSKIVKGKELGTYISKDASGILGTRKMEEAEESEEDTNESFDIDALIAEIEAELEEGKMKKADDEEVKEAKKKDDEEKAKMEEELAEALSTVATLQETISEMNLLNSKLLYCNKLFRANALNEAQKVKVIDALDKASTTGEAKLVFETLQESFTFTGVEKKAIKEGLGRASKPAGVAPKKVITESVDDTVLRFQKLANIKL